jgi:hypothetical protein
MQNLIMITDPICCFSLSFKMKHYLIQRRGLHTSPIVPAITYTNADTLKELAIKENKDKSGVYR